MLQDSASPHSNDEKRAALADAAWALLATHDIDKIGFDMVADMAGIEHGLARALGGSVQRLVLAKIGHDDFCTLMLRSNFYNFHAKCLMIFWIVQRSVENRPSIFPQLLCEMAHRT